MILLMFSSRNEEPLMETSEAAQRPPTTAGFFFDEVTNSIEAVGSTPTYEFLGRGVMVVCGCDGLAVILDEEGGGDEGGWSKRSTTGVPVYGMRPRTTLPERSRALADVRRPDRVLHAT